MIFLYQSATNFILLDELWFKTGVGKNIRFIAIHTLASKMGSSMCKILPVVHAISGCDSVSSFSGIGKKKVIQVLLITLHFCEGIKMLLP